MLVAAALASGVLPVGRAHAQSVVPEKAALCDGCHGATGTSSDPRYPVLAGQTARYLYLQLRDFAAGRRWDPQMSPTAAGLSEPEMRGLAQWYAQQAQVAPAYEFDALKVARGKAKADEVLCTACHLGGYVGQNEVPRIAGQHYAYVVKQLRDFRARRRTDDAGAMTSLSDTLSEADIENLAHYLASL